MIDPLCNNCGYEVAEVSELGYCQNCQRAYDLGREGKQVKEKIISELENVRDEMQRAETEDLTLLEGWEKALLWVLRQYEGEGK